MKFLKTAAVLTALPLLAACAGKYDVDGAKMAANSGSVFQKELQSEYARLAGLEKGEDDWTDAAYFVEKTMAATQGVVGPQKVSDRMIPGEHVDVAMAEYRKLTAALNAGAGDLVPSAAARAQAGYDCWIQELEENNQPDDIAACKKYYDVAMVEVMAALEAQKAEAAPAPAVVMDDVIVYFDFDSTALNAEAETMISKAAAMAKKAGVVMVTGHTDTSGADAYNEALALDRATVVADALKASGVNARSIRVTANGENATAVSTGDEVREARNRRVEISFK